MSTHRSRNLCLFSVCCLAVLLAAPLAARAAVTGQITGKVTKTGGVGLANITVNAYASVDDYNNGNQAASTQTNGDGSYDLGGLPAGSYLIEFRDDTKSNYVTQFYNNKATIDTANPVPVTAGATHAGVNVVLAVAGHITGKVTKAGGVGLADILVRAYASVDDYNNGIGAAGTQTNGDGSYNLGGLPTGSYLVVFGGGMGPNNYLEQWYNNQPTIDTANPVPVTAGVTTPGIKATLAPAGHITGKVTKAGGVALANIDVYAYASVADYNSGHQIAFDWTADDGSYDLGGLPTGSYLVSLGASIWVGAEVPGNWVMQFYNNEPTIDTANPVPVTAGATHAGINAMLVPAISGTMRLDNGAAATNKLTVTANSAVTGATQMRFASYDYSSSAWVYTAWQPYAATATVTIYAPDGNKRVTAYYRDAAGNNYSTSDTIILDTVPPSGTMLLNGGAAVTTSTTVTANSAVTGATQMRFASYDYGSTAWVYTAWQPYAATATVTIYAPDGNKRVTAYYRDAAGNNYSTSDTIILSTG